MSEPGQRQPAEYTGPAWERKTVAILIAAYVGLCLNAVGHDTLYGQDFPFHQMATLRFAAGTPRWFFMDPTSRPMLYLLGSLGVRVLGEVRGFYAASIAFVAMGALALGLLHDTLRRFIASPLLRVSALALVAFLPTTLVTTVVYAADTLALLPFVLAGWSLVRLLDARTSEDRLKAAVIGALAFTLGNVAKATFFVLPAAGVIALIAAWRLGRLPRKELVRLGLVLAALPLLVGFAFNRAANRAEAESPNRHTFDWHGTGEMTVRSLVFPKPADALIFQAPTLFDSPVDPSTHKPWLTENNGLSYPGLLHLGIFSDVLNFAGNNVYLSRPRPELQARFSRASIALGVIFSLGSLLAVVVLSARLLAGFVNADWAPRPTLGAWLCLALGWYLPLALILPFVHHAYEWGYWLPRLTLPALWVFFICLFERLDSWLPSSSRRWVEPVVAGLVALQCILGVASVWYA